jgi:hypothetical protein
MHVDWEAVTAVASLLSSLAVLAAIIVGIRQVRIGASQVDHLRRATQLQGTMEVFDRLFSPDQVDARNFILTELSAKMQDPVYLAELARGRFVPQTHPEMRVLRLMEMIGTYVRHGLLDEAIIFDIWVSSITDTWDALDRLGVIALHRQSSGSLQWENFELLAVRARRWLARHEPGALLPLASTETTSSTR